MKVLIGTDGSEDAIRAAREGLALLAQPTAVTLMCVVEPPAIETAGLESGFAGGVASPEQVDAAWDALRAEAERALEQTAAALGPDAPIERVIERGTAGPILCWKAEELATDAIVVGSRGRSAIKRALLGSVSTHVVNNAPCPVVVVRADR
jgi:nucleotide-binding universal stress UspA family protein